MEKRVSFDEIRANNIRSGVLIFFFLCIAAGLGLILGLFWGSIWGGLITAVLVAIIYSIIAYHNGRGMITSLMHAKPATKKEYPYLVNTVEGLALAAGVPTPKIYVMKDSARNAFATGTGPNDSAIVVTTGLLEVMDRQELEGVIAHEMSHIQNYDIRTMLVAAVIAGVIVLLADILLRSFLWGGGRRDNNNGGGVLIVVGLVLAILSPIIAQLIQLAISRKREFAADAGAAVLTRYPPGLASALKKIEKDPDPLVDTANRATAHLFISTPFAKHKGFFTNLFSTHPPLQERIKRLEQM